MFGLIIRPDAKLSSPENRRREPREAVDEEAYIDLADHVVSARMVDLSRSGARLVVPPSRMLPSSFPVRVPSLGLRASARLVWRQAHQCGVAFYD